MSSTHPITAAMLYDLVQCAHRPSMDLFGDPKKRDEISPFVRMLWEKGTTFEHKVLDGLQLPILDLSMYAGDEKEYQTFEAMRRRERLIYSARISADGLLGEPDLLRLQGDGYVAGDIKSGAGEFGDGYDTKQKKHYGVQLALYTDILERTEFSSSRRPFIWDVNGDEVTYDLEVLQSMRAPWTMWELYQATLLHAQGIVAQTQETIPAYSGACKLCHWYSACISELEKLDDLTLLPELGRSRRDAMVGLIPTVSEFSSINVEGFITGKRTVFRGIGVEMLRKFHERAKLNTEKGAVPYLTRPISLPHAETELFFDIEVDPMRDLCYLHGFVERRGGQNSTEKYVAFFTESVTNDEEERAFTEAWKYIAACQPCVVYYYSKYERTIWRKLQRKFPSVCTAEDIENLFNPNQSVDLYFDVVKAATEWPTRDHSIKTLAKYLGFRWRDTHPSGAASIEWFDRWIQTGNDTIKQRILDYNEDDCIATRVVLDGIRGL